MRFGIIAESSITAPFYPENRIKVADLDRFKEMLCAFACDKVEGVIGVGPAADGRIPSVFGSVSNRHALWRLEDNVMFLRGAPESTFGTKVNGEPLGQDAERELRPGDQVEFGTGEGRYTTRVVEVCV